MSPPEQHPAPKPSGDLFHDSASGTTDFLARLNDAQREAVTRPDGALLVLAGAGSGKTRVITHRVAYLVDVLRVPAERIIAVTFTNKAAEEMRQRVERLVGDRLSGGWIGTFHALCLRILRRDGARIGLEPGFNIYDSADQLALVKRILRDESGESNPSNPRGYLSKISRAKNSLQSPDDLERRARTPDRQLLVRVFRGYEEALRRANAVDFDDLLVRTLDLFREHESVVRRYAEACQHLLVDEYQDTNRPQYLLVRALSAVHGNVCVVGDEDQSIYRFRGAEIRNILEFEADHPGAVTVRLEQNYRSSGTILAAASAVIANNVLRKGKTLWTENDRGEPIELMRAPDDRAEAAWVAQTARRLGGTTPFEDVAVLYRTNAQSRQLEEIFRRDRIPYRVVGSLQFYERKEVKDVLAYLKLAANPGDDVAFRRVVNTPSRGIGDTTLAAIERVARAYGLPLARAAVKVREQGAVAPRSARSLGAFLALIEDLRARVSVEAVAELIENVIERVGYEAYLGKVYGPDGADRMENVRGLVSAAVEYEEEDDEPSLAGFLDRSALVSDADDVGAGPGVTLMTIHCAKGLEFPVVFLVGMEENLFPHAMTLGNPEDVEEERRLCYVAMTRAEQQLLVSWAQFRRMHGQFLPSDPSRFLAEIPTEHVREVVVPSARPSWDLRGAPEDGYRTSGSSAARAARRRSAPPEVVATGGAAPKDGFAAGRYVNHPRFGSGRIIKREGDGKHLKLTIHFSNFGPKKILPAYTKLMLRTDQGSTGRTR